jgi:hypothetical protein
MSEKVHSRTDAYPVTTGELIGMGMESFGKQIPGFGAILDYRSSVLLKLEQERVRGILEYLMKAIGDLKGTLSNERSAAILLYGCDQARNDILCVTKTNEYGAAIKKSFSDESSLDEVMQLFDNLRKVNADDIKYLRKFRSPIKADGRPFVELAEITNYDQMSPNNLNAVRDRTAVALATAMRLQGLGVLILAPQKQGGMLPMDIGPLREYLQHSVFLTAAGIRLADALSAV